MSRGLLRDYEPSDLLRMELFEALVLTPAAAGLLTATHLLTTAGPWSPAAAAAASCLGLGWQSSSMALLAPATTLLSLPPSSSQHCRHMPIYGNTWCRCWASPRRRAARACWPRSAPPRPTPPRAQPRLTGARRIYRDIQ